MSKKSLRPKAQNSLKTVILSIATVLMLTGVFFAVFVSKNITSSNLKFIDYKGQIVLSPELTGFLAGRNLEKVSSLDKRTSFINEFQDLVSEISNNNLNDELVKTLNHMFGKKTIAENYDYYQEINDYGKSLAYEAHRLVLRENGGEWKATFQMERVIRILYNLCSSIGENIQDYSITLLNKLSVNAFSTADGRIYLTKGLLTYSTDAEIAFTLAHEMHHIISGHWVNLWSDMNAKVWNGINKPYYSGVLELVKAGISELMTDSTSSYEQELQADAYAFFITTRAGYNKDDFLRIINAMPKVPTTSHPEPLQRLESLEKMALAMEEPLWEKWFNPVEIALERFEKDLKVDILASDAESLEAKTGSTVNDFSVIDFLDIENMDESLVLKKSLEEIQERFNLFLTTFTRLADKRDPKIEYHKTIREELEERFVTSAHFIVPYLSYVDIGINTSFSNSTAGSIGKNIGRIWLLKTFDKGWIIIAANAEYSDIGIKPNSYGDDLQFLADSIASENEKTAIMAIDKWRNTFISDLRQHIDTYSEDVREQLIDFISQDTWHITQDELKDGQYWDIAWSWFSEKYKDIYMSIWDLQKRNISSRTAIYNFSFRIKAGSIAFQSGNASLILTKEYSEWKVYMLIIN